MRKRNIFALTSIVAAFVLLGAGCFGSTTAPAARPTPAPMPAPSPAPEPTPTPTTTSTPAPTPTPAPAPTTGGSGNGGGTTGSPKVPTASVSIRNFAFSPKTITVSVGTNVTWTNNDSVTHTVVGDVGGVPMPSGDMRKGESYSYVFDVDGTFTYHCGPHPSMIGTVTVTP